MTYFIILLNQIIASLSHIVAKDVTSQVDTNLILFYRTMIAAAIAFGWIMLNPYKYKPIERKDIPVFLILSALSVPINQFLFVASIRLTTAPNVALAYALSPAFVLTIAILFAGERPNKIKVIGIVLAISGTVLILLERGLDMKSDYFTGNILVLIASLAWSLYTVIGKYYTMKYGALYSTCLTMIIGFFMYIPIYMMLPVTTSFYDISAISWLQIMYLGVFTSFVGYVLWYFALKRIEASSLSVFNNFQPVLTTIMSILIFGTVLTPQFIAGGVLIIAGVWLTQRKY